MYITRLVLDHYRSWNHCLVDFSAGLNVLVGHNGLGKTNIVEAIEFLSTGTSHRVNSSLPLVENGQKSAVIRANVEEKSSGNEQYSTTLYQATVTTRGANRARVNGGQSLFMRDIVGKIRCVTFAPEDQLLVSMDPAHRRKFIDSAASQYFHDYSTLLNNYNHIAKQRVALLRQVAHARNSMTGNGQSIDMTAMFTGLEIWTSQLIATGVEITKRRNEIIEALQEPFTRIYSQLAGKDQNAHISYAPSFSEVFDLSDKYDYQTIHSELSNHFQRLYEGEVAQGRNLIGPHRDDLIFTLNGMTAKEYASNGELWTLALALKMAMFEVLSNADNVPILILDDVFSQLDNSRRSQIIEFARAQQQVLITAASRDDIPNEITQNDNAAIIDVEEILEKSMQWNIPTAEEMQQVL